MEKKGSCGCSVFKTDKERNQEWVTDANAIVEKVEGHNPEAHAEKRKEVRDAFEEKGTPEKKKK